MSLIGEFAFTPTAAKIQAFILQFTRQKDCALCLNDLTNNDIYTVFECNHIYHTECLIPIMQKMNNDNADHIICPNCRCRAYRKNFIQVILEKGKQIYTKRKYFCVL
mgnify:CR=1 FL=1